MERKITNQFHGITQFFNILRYVRKSGEVTPFDGIYMFWWGCKTCSCKRVHGLSKSSIINIFWPVVLYFPYLYYIFIIAIYKLLHLFKKYESLICFIWSGHTTYETPCIYISRNPNRPADVCEPRGNLGQMRKF